MALSFKLLGVRIEVSYLLISMMALFSYFDESGIFLAAFFSALLHESGHIIATVILKIPIKELAFKPFGIRMKLRTPMELVSFKKKIIVLLGGCIVNFLCFFLFWALCRKISDYALIHLITAIFNLLPSGTLDGGRILSEILLLKIDAQKTAIFCDVVSIIFAILLFVLGFFILVKTKYNFSLLITAIYLFIMVIVRQKKLK